MAWTRIRATSTLSIRATSSRRASTCRAASIANPYPSATSSTTCAAPKCARSQPWGHFASSRSTISGTTATGLPTCGTATLSTSAREGLIRHIASVDRETGTDLVTLTERGRELLESHRSPDHEPRQTFHDGLARERELVHDAQLYRAYLRASERLVEQGAHVERVILEQDLRREYQVFLQEPNRGRADSDGRPGRDRDDVRRWAEDHDLPYADGRVQFPDFQIEFLWPDGRRDIENVEVLTPHYRGAHAAGKVRAGFTRFRGIGARAGGKTGRGSRFDPGLAEELV